MNRRAFLKTLAAAVAGATLDPEKLLWIPGQKKIFLPPVTEFGRPLTIEMLQDAMRQIAARGGDVVHTYMASPTIIRRYNEMMLGDLFAGVDEDKRLPDGSLVLGGRLDMRPPVSNREIARAFARSNQSDEIQATLGKLDRNPSNAIFHVSLDEKTRERGATVVVQRGRSGA